MMMPADRLDLVPFGRIGSTRAGLTLDLRIDDAGHRLLRPGRAVRGASRAWPEPSRHRGSCSCRAVPAAAGPGAPTFR
jgi:hypothetical protein